MRASSLLLFAIACGTPTTGADLRVSISPENPTTIDALTVSLTNRQPGVHYRFEWFEDGESAALREQTVPADRTRSNTTWRIEVHARGEQNTAKASVQIQNTPPEAPIVEILPTRAWVGTELTCGLVEDAFDVDGDALQYTVQWLRDGTPFTGALDTSAFEGDVVPLGTVLGGEIWSCLLTPTDGVDAGESGLADLTVLEAPGGNVLLVLVDDVGIDKVAAYGEHDSPAITPVINSLAEEGILFRNVYARSVCSPARAALMTGRHGRRYGMGGIVHVATTTFELPVEERMLPEAVRESPVYTYSMAAAGKWHLSGFNTPSSWEHPVLAGWDWYGGSLGNLKSASWNDGIVTGFYHWEKNVNGEAFFTDLYATTDTIDDAIDLVQTLPEPWLVYVALNAPHVPTHVPPEDLLTELVDESSPGEDKFEAALEAADTEIGRLLASMTPEVRAETTVILLSDNGTPRGMVRAPWDPDRAKGTVFEAGVNVPMIVTGPLLSGARGEAHAFVDITDVFATIAEITGAPIDDSIDGNSLLQIFQDPSHPGERDHIVVDRFLPNGPPPYTLDQWMVRDENWELVWYAAGTVMFFDMNGRDVEGDPLDLAALDQTQQDNFNRLLSLLADEQATRVYGSP